MYTTTVSSDYSTGLITGVITGIIATVVGFILTMLYERWKSKKAEKVSIKKTLSILIGELQQNQSSAKFNASLFESNLTDLAALPPRVGVSPPSHYRESSWHIALSNGIQSMVDDGCYELLVSTYFKLGYSNDVVNAREIYRLNNGAMSNYIDALRIYDTILEEQTNSILDLINKSLEGLKVMQGKQKQ